MYIFVPLGNNKTNGNGFMTVSKGWAVFLFKAMVAVFY